jgi:ferredoxin-like protein FixX
MKRILFLVIAFLGTAMLTAQDQDRDRDRLMMVDGDVLQIRDRDQIRLQAPIRLNDGTLVNPNGSYTTRNNNRLRLKDGECLDNDGVKYRNEYQYRYKVQQENKGLSDAQIQERNQNRYHIMLVDGEAVQIRNQSQNRLQQQLELADGTNLNPDGSYQTKDRQQLRLQDGECLNMAGQKFMNTYQHRKMTMQNKMLNKKGVKKPKVQKKKGKNFSK